MFDVLAFNYHAAVWTDILINLIKQLIIAISRYYHCMAQRVNYN